MQNLQIVLTRENQSVPWGFRLKGGAEYNVPLSILKVASTKTITITIIILLIIIEIIKTCVYRLSEQNMLRIFMAVSKYFK